MDVLIHHAYQRASAPVSDRTDARVVTKELAAIAGDELDGVREAWDYCVQRYATEEELAWLLAATYLLPLVVKRRTDHAQPPKRARH